MMDARPLFDQRQRLRCLTAEQRAAHQLERLNALLANILPRNRFYAEKLSGLSLPIESWEDFQELPFTTKCELEEASAADPAAVLTYPRDDYVRWHRTSGSRGRPLIVQDTAADWQWWIETWQYVLDAAQIQPSDRAMMAFSFGPFIGFWSANDALLARGAQVIPGGGLSTAARLQLLRDGYANVVCCTPTYALRMIEVARQEQIELADCAVDRLIVAGEPGGSLPTVRKEIERGWSARVVDHVGATEIGPWGYANEAGTGTHVCEAEFHAELLPLDQPYNGREAFELVLTTLGRYGWPVIRYRTGDLVCPAKSPAAEDTHLFLEGGVLSRVDDMVVIRGVNIFPQNISEQILASNEFHEHRITATRQGALDELNIEVESDNDAAADALARSLHDQFGLRIPVTLVAAGTLPRSEAKSKRFVDRR